MKKMGYLHPKLAAGTKWERPLGKCHSSLGEGLSRKTVLEASRKLPTRHVSIEAAVIHYCSQFSGESQTPFWEAQIPDLDHMAL